MLFAIRLEVSKATGMDSEYIILITNSLGSARKCHMQVYLLGNYIPTVLSSSNYTSLPFTAAIFLTTHLMAVLQPFRYSVFHRRDTPVSVSTLKPPLRVIETILLKP